jgi:hypothetical protein
MLHLSLVWDNTINLSDIISVLSLFVIFWTLNEMRKQRQESNKVELSIQSNKTFFLQPDERGYLDLHNIGFDVTNISNNSIYKLDVFYHPNFREIIEIFSEADLKLIHEVKTNGDTIIDGFYMDDSLYANNRIAQLESDYTFSIDQIISLSKEECIVPWVYMSLYHKLCKLTFGKATKTISGAAMRFPKLPIHVRYENIHRKMQNKYLLLSISFHSAGVSTDLLGFGLRIREVSKKTFNKEIQMSK